MLVDDVPYYEYSSADILPVDDISIAIVLLHGLKGRSARIVPRSKNQNEFNADLSRFETLLDTAIRALEELRFLVIKNKQISGGGDLYSREELPTDELSIAIAILNNTKIRAELSITHPFGGSTLDAEQQKTMDEASSAIDWAIALLKNFQT